MVDSRGPRIGGGGMRGNTEEDHILWLEAQVRQIDEIGLENYLQQQI